MREVIMYIAIILLVFSLVVAYQAHKLNELTKLVLLMQTNQHDLVEVVGDVADSELLEGE